MYKIGIVGDRDSVLGYMAIGFSVHEAQDAESAERELAAMVKSGEYAVIFLVEQYAEKISESLKKYKDMPIPAITVIPGAGGTDGYGMASLKSAVERAVGVDILFKNNQ